VRTCPKNLKNTKASAKNFKGIKACPKTFKDLATTNDISDLPPVPYARSVRACNLRITINPDKTIKVTVPKQSTQKQAERFLQSKISWVKKHLHKIEQQEKLQAGPELSEEELIKAQEYLFSRLDYFSSKYNLSYNRAVFRCQKTKWGSCSDKKNINLNINIAYLPKELQEYILLSRVYLGNPGLKEMLSGVAELRYTMLYGQSQLRKLRNESNKNDFCSNPGVCPFGNNVMHRNLFIKLRECQSC
jgi:hypothetical protein